MEPFQMNLWIGLAVMLIYGLLCGGWIYLLMRNAKPGWRRLQPAVPVMVLNCLIPFIFNPTLVPQRHSLFSALPRMVSSFCFMWVGNFKILAYCLNRGMLKDAENLSFRQFCGVLICAIHPKLESDAQNNLQEKGTKVARWLGLIAFKLCLMLIFSFAITNKQAHIVLNRFGYCACTYLSLSICFDFASALAITLFNVDSHDAFDMPFLSRDTADFWGRRWNTMTATVLKHLSYDLVIDGMVLMVCCVYKSTFQCFVTIGSCRLMDVQDPDALKNKPTDLQKGLATMSIFFLSGTIHLILFWYVTYVWAWRWFIFFIIFAVALIAERVLKKVYSKQLGLPTAPLVIRIVLTFLFHFLVYAGFFAPPLARSKISRLFSAFQLIFIPPSVA